MSAADDFHLKLNCKKLNSGKCQVKFEVRIRPKRQFYGYLITQPEEKLKDVVRDITDKLSALRNVNDPYHQRLYSIGKAEDNFKDFVVFQSKPASNHDLGK